MNISEPFYFGNVFRKASPERPSELEMTAISQIDTLDSSTAETVERLAVSLPARTSKVCLSSQARLEFKQEQELMRVDKRSLYESFVNSHVLVKREQELHES